MLNFGENFYNYLSKNEGNVYLTIFILLFFGILLGYLNVMFYLRSLKKNWNNIRCNPIYIPFASIINPNPNNKQSALEYTASNFSNCTNSILSSVVQDFTAPIYYIFNTINSSVKGIVSDIQKVRQRIFTLIKNIENIDKSIMSKIFATTIPLQSNIINLKDAMKKSQAVGTVSAMTMVGGYFGLSSFIKNFVNIAIEGLLILVGIIVPLLIFIFTIPVAIPLLVIFGVIAGAVTTVIIELNSAMHRAQTISNPESSVLLGQASINRSVKDIPKKPSCFDENTLLQLENNTFKKIKDLNLGEKLKFDGVVQGIFKINSKVENMYIYKGVIVSGSHNVYENGIWIPIKKTSSAERINNYDKDNIYCLNTGNGTITINHIIFSDWNDIDGYEFYYLKHKHLTNKENIKTNNFKLQKDCDLHNNFDLHNNLEYGFIGTTNIRMKDNSLKKIKHLNINDELYNGEKILGIVKIYGKDLDAYYYPKLKLYGTTNINIETKEIENTKIKINNKYDVYYNILTNTNNFIVNNIELNDYNGGLEKLLSN